MLDSLAQIRQQPWKTVSPWHLAVTSLGFAWLVYLLKTDDDGFIFLDYVNLAFHEAGHPIFGIFGATLGLYGGTIGQVVFPVVAELTFWRQREPVGCAVAGIWLFENFLNIARYMADARAQVLPLVGGGEHDWADIFTRWGVLSSDTAIAHVVAKASWIGMVSLWGWLVWQWWKPEGSDG